MASSSNSLVQTSGLPTVEELRGMSSVQLDRCSREVFQKIQRLENALESMRMISNADDSANAGVIADTVCTMETLRKRLMEHKHIVDAEQTQRRMRVRECVEMKRDETERKTDFKVQSSLQKGEERVSEIRHELLADARRKGDEYTKKRAQIIDAMAERQEQAVSQADKRAAEIKARLEMKTAAVSEAIQQQAEQRRLAREQKAARAEANRQAKEEALRERQNAPRSASSTPSEALLIATKGAGYVRRTSQARGADTADHHHSGDAIFSLTEDGPRTASKQGAKASCSTPMLPSMNGGSTSLTRVSDSFARLTKPKPHAELNALEEKHAKGFERALDARKETMNHVRKQAHAREDRSAQALERAEEDRKKFLSAKYQSDDERNRRMKLMAEEQERLMNAIKQERQAHRDSVLWRAKSAEPSAAYATNLNERHLSKAMSAMAAVCGELLGEPELASVLAKRHPQSATPSQSALLPPVHRIVAPAVGQKSDGVPTDRSDRRYPAVMATPHAVAPDKSAPTPALGFEVSFGPSRV